MKSCPLVFAVVSMILVSIAGLASQAAAQTTAATSSPTPAPAERPAAQIDSRAADLITQLKSAYSKLTALETAGKASGHFDVAGQKKQQEQEFSGSFTAPNKFRHESKEGVVLGSTGEKLYIFLPAENVYSSTDASKERLANVPLPIANMLFGENPSLLMAISQEPLRFIDGFSARRMEDVTLDGKAYAALRVDRDSDDLTFLVDPSNHLLRRVTMDLRKTIAQRGAPDIKLAEFIVDYASVIPDGAPKAEQYAWAPPQGARDAAAAAAPNAGRSFDAKTQLVGKPAPDFTLKDLAGNDVKLADTKGSVTLLDFWATWCPPCVEGMPNLERIHKERAKEGIRVIAINAMEEKDKVAAFVKARSLTLPVVLDADGKAGESYELEGYPTSVIIKRDGTIHKVLHPVGPEGERALEEALGEALKEK